MIPDEDKPTPTYWINFNAATGEAIGSFVCESELASIPLWADPPIKRKPLSDETLWEMWVESPSDVLRFARAVERAHGINES
jgi:hypothetical protein